MPTIKISPPERLPEGSMTEQQFQTFKTELKVYLMLEENFRPYIVGKYKEWEAAEDNQDRITLLVPEDMVIKTQDAEGHVQEVQKTQLVKDSLLEDRQTNLELFLSLIAKVVSPNHYSTVMEHSTSLKWVFDMIREDYDIQTRGIHILNILDLKYNEATMKPVGFYNNYRTIVMNNLRPRGFLVQYKNNKELATNETISPTFEDFILIEVLRLIDSRLPAHIREVYAHKIVKDKCIMDFKTDILVNVDKFKREIDDKEQMHSIRVQGEPSLAAMWSGGGGRGAPRQHTPYQGSSRGAGWSARGAPRGTGRGAPRGGVTRPPGWSETHCKDCWRDNKGRNVYNSHNTGDVACPTGNKFGNLEADGEGQEATDWERQEEEEYKEEEQICLNKVSKASGLLTTPDLSAHPSDLSDLNTIQPVPTQILTVFEDKSQTKPIHIGLDNGANVSYITLKQVKERGFKMKQNNQMSKLGDGRTLLPAMGEIDVTLYRNEWTVQFRALVVQNLHTDFVGGTTFIKENGVMQDFVKGTISLHNKKHMVIDTKHESTMQVSNQQKVTHLAHMKTGTSTLLQGQSMEVEVEMPEGSVVVVEGWHSNVTDWPGAELCEVRNNRVALTNNTKEPIIIGKKGDIKTLKVSKTVEKSRAELKQADPSFYTFNNMEANNMPKEDNTKEISMGKEIKQEVRRRLDVAHRDMAAVFDESLQGGYNGYYGPHECRLNWAGKERPPSNKLRVANYNHALNGLLQEVMDEMTRQGVLQDPQQLGITVQSVCLVFLQRKIYTMAFSRIT